MKRKNLLIAIVAGVALSAGLFVGSGVIRFEPPDPRRATILPTAPQVPAFRLLDQHGRMVDERVFEGQWDLVFFGFTNCPDVCPLTLQTLAVAKRELAAAGHSPLPRIVLVSVDPERDTPARVAQYVDAFGEGNLGITGELDELRKLTRGLGIFFEKRPGDGEQYNVDHSSVVLVVDPQGRFRALFSSPHEIDDYVHDLPLVLGRR
ncbi:MAG: SCO family protein [Woeseiaceae bacterium]|nr:SCO family protein [Woeseiaceae bacterium]